ncbi:MAG: helix-turn-helix transcriptional regulator [Lentisphaeria bacterium]|nr:helix-turn-helix transcriptional regulator [Lentisphaeria bacterium]
MEEYKQKILFSQASQDKIDASVQVHSHPGVELILISGGACRISVDKESFECRAGMMLVVPPESPHDQVCLRHVVNSFIVFHCPPEMFSPACRLVNLNEDPWCIRLFRLVCELSENKRYDLCEGVLLSLLAALRRLEERLRKDPELHPGLQKAIDLLETEFLHQLSMEELARRAGVSHSYLRRLFERKFQISPQRYLQNIRMAHARQYLLNTKNSVAEVAALCGYPDSNYFTRLFRQLHRCAPGEYRDIMRNRPGGFRVRM